MHTIESTEDEDKAKKSFLKKNSALKEGEIKRLLSNHKEDNTYLDLSNFSLLSIPSDLLMLPHLQHLYLEGNNVAELPDNFFDRLPALVWLDLRNNKLHSLPTSIGRHQSIKNLLLEGNCLTHLPLQLGLTKSLTGLNLRGNPLLVPPQHIIDQGVYVILSYLYQELQNRTKQPNQIVQKEVEKLSLSDESVNSDDEEILTEAINFTGRNIPSPMSDDFELVRHGPTPVSASFHKPLSYMEYKGRFHTNTPFESLRKNKPHSGRKHISLFDVKEQEEMRKEQLRAMRERQISQADQRRKNVTALQEWRKEATRRQNSAPRSKPAVKVPPYAIENNSIEVHQDVREEKVVKVIPDTRLQRRTHLFVEIPNKVNETVDGFTFELDRKDSNSRAKGESQQNVTKALKIRPNSVAKKNEAVQQRIREHSTVIRNQMKQLRNDVEQLSQKQDSNKEFQRHLLDRKMSQDPQLEYRFRAFTGDSMSLYSGSNKTSSM